MSHIAPISMKVRTTLGAYRIVSADTAGANFAVYPSSVAHKPIGVTKDTVKDTNEAIPVIIGGIAKVQFNDTMSSGGLVAADANGYGVKFVAVTTGTFYLGTLIGPAVTQTGTVADVLIQPGASSIP